VQAKNAGDLAVFELKSAFAKAGDKIMNKLSLVKTFRVAVSGLNIGAAVPASAKSILATATDAKGTAKVI
jgi:hypothetical protein